MKRFFVLMFIAFALSSCKKEETKNPILGSWELVSIETKAASIGSVSISVSLSFFEDGRFAMEQTIGEGRPVSFSGTYTLSGTTLSGVYSDGKKWGDSYTVAVSGDTMTLTSSDGKETDTYKAL